MSELIHVYANGMTLHRNGSGSSEAAEDQIMLVNAAGDTALSMFYPNQPQRLDTQYSYPVALLTMAQAVSTDTRERTPVLHLGGAGTTVARCLLGAGMPHQTVVDIEPEITADLIRRFPPPGKITLITGDARDYVHLGSTHPIVIIDLLTDPPTSADVALHQELLDELCTPGTSASPAPALIINLHSRPETTDSLDAIWEHLRRRDPHAKRLDSHALKTTRTGNAILVSANLAPHLAHIDHELPGWSVCGHG